VVLMPSNLKSYTPGTLISADGGQVHEDGPSAKTPEMATGPDPGSATPATSGFGFIATVFQSASLRPVFIIHFALAFATMLFQSNFVLVLEELGLPPRQSAFMMAYMGVIGVITSSFVLRLLTQRWSESFLISKALLGVAASLIMFPLVPSVTGFMLVLIPFVISLRVLRSCLMSVITTKAPKDRTGAVLGVADAVESGNRAIAPIIGGASIQAFGTFAPAVMGSLVTLLSYIYLASTNVAGE
jgi:MFS transporter, DHA1 family, tetracycline resistance protein